jgi:hypothetical protein
LVGIAGSDQLKGTMIIDEIPSSGAKLPLNLQIERLPISSSLE